MEFCVVDAGNEKIHKDESVRLWKVYTGICILVVAGAEVIGIKYSVWKVTLLTSSPTSKMELVVK